jgi:hypothetical protein
MSDHLFRLFVRRGGMWSAPNLENSSMKLHPIIDKPVGVSGYELTHIIPEKLKDSLPDTEELEEKILFEFGLDENYNGN